MTSMKNRLRRLEKTEYIQDAGPTQIEVVGIDPQTGEEVDGFTIEVSKTKN